MSDERDPAECISAVIETHDRNGFIVRLGRADGDIVPPIWVKTMNGVIELVREMNPPRIRINLADSKARDALLLAFGTNVEVDDYRPQMRRPTLH